MPNANAALIQRVLYREGSLYTDAPADRGGPTKFGITLETLRIYRSEPMLTAEAVKGITAPTAADIYLTLYLEDPGIAQIEDLALRELLFDSAIQHGPSSALKDGRFYCIGWLQECVGAPVDRILGPATLAHVKATVPRIAFANVFRRRLLFYAAIVEHDATQLEWLNGWLHRMGDLLGDCLADMGVKP